MHTVNATWEKRNIGVECNEITIEADDTVEFLIEEIPKNETAYTVIKVPAGMIGMLFCLQKMGYLFIETMTTCYHNAAPFHLNRIQQRIIDRTEYEKMNDSDINFMFEEINKGLFTTDRIALDPAFTIEQSNHRYACWIKDELEHGSKLYKLVYGDKDFGFFGIKKQTEHDYYAFLGGVYPAFLSSGFGFSTNYYEIEEGRRLGAKRIKSLFSSNNRGAAAIHLSLGYALQQQYYVLIKHGQQKT